MPSGGYGIGEKADADRVSDAIASLEDSGHGHMLADWIRVYIAARMQGAPPGEAARAAYIEWDL